MKLEIKTPVLQSWQVAGWIEQCYSVISRVKDYEGIVVNVRPGHIVIDTGECKLIDVQNIPTQLAYFDGVDIIVGEEE